MEAKIVKKQDIAGWIDSLIQEYDVFAPVKDGDLVNFEKIDSASEAFLDYQNPKIPPKRVLLPQSEMLFSYASTKDAAKIKLPLAPEKPRLIFGVRPCDARSLVLLDGVFDGEYKDTYYLDRRAGTTVVSLGCVRPRSTCFCNWSGGSPFSTEGSDLLLTDIGDEYVVKIVTEKGQALLKGRELKDATDAQLALAEEVGKRNEASMAPGVKLDELKEKLDSSFDDPEWKLLTEKCLGCGVCTYLCPTCHCFDIVDEVVGSNGERLRLWDSCQFPLFTLQTSGDNPRPTVRERYRQRIMHKFSYFVDNHNRVACVGCGRCVIECPVNLDIRQVLNRISQLEGVS